MFKFDKEMLIPPPEEIGLKTEIATTIKIPVTVQTRLIYLFLNVSRSALIINGIEKIINPINKELIL